MKLITALSLVLPAMLLAAAARAVDLTPWDSMPASINGSVAIHTRDGKTYKDRAIEFTASTVTLPQHNIVIQRDNVEGITIRKPRERCCGEDFFFALPLLGLLAGGPPDNPLAFFIALPLSAVSGASFLIIEGIRRLKPAKVLYKVRP